MALTQGIEEALWLHELLGDLGVQRHLGEITQIQCDNQGAIALTKKLELEYHACTKHIDIQYHCICQHVESGAIPLID